ncbi:GntR family transcriptional regulator [Desulfitibacter alkalitolerans]|uniref:GntR family transcriptional regulator n=1 Tax=Desulfitibacter alkalitolerans TaxID=264641 RepID=UPI000685F54E|nr:GntR family transcriptional regulator [Desulfitibacter alkalitolerans]
MNQFISKTTLKEQAYSYLKKAILKGEIEAGRIYSEQWFADFLGVSRTPVREAILQIRQEGLLETLPSKGIIVKEISPADIESTFQIRQAIEGFCVVSIAREVNSHAAQDLLNSLYTLIDTQKEAAGYMNSYRFTEVDELFHRHIINFVNNNKFVETFDDLRIRVYRLCMDTLKTEGRMRETVNEHYEIYEKMKAGQPWEAYMAMNQHLSNAKKLLLSVCKH